ncbi:MAG: hypothetical protein ACJ76P_12760 [Actinomycetota bacterium]
MPRRNRRVPEEFVPATAPRSVAPEWANSAGFEVREVTGDKPYRCPGCDHVIKPGVRHLVAVPVDDPDERRHWHTECWRKELKRSRR